MADYIGIKCISCGKDFEKDDDIVVCPECGTPYHRDCYKKEGKCINTELHEKGGSFKITFGNSEAINEKKRCPRCGTENGSLTLFCEKCGMPLSMPQLNPNDNNQQPSQGQPNIFGAGFNSQAFQADFTDPLCGINAEEDFDGVNIKELADFVGTNTFYYLPIFKRLKDIKHKLSWNFPAMLFPSAYFAYRKMYLQMILCIIVQLIVYIPSLIVVLATTNLGSSALTEWAQTFDIKGEYFQIVYNTSNFLNYALMFIAGLFSNWLYYCHAIRKIKELKDTGKATREVIRAKGGPSQLSLILLLVSPFILGAITFVFTVATQLFSM